MVHAVLYSFKRESCFVCAVDASKAGSGNIEIVINDGNIPCHVTQRSTSSSQFHASFVPKDADVHYVAMTFNGCTVPGITAVDFISDSRNTRTCEPTVGCVAQW